MSDYFDQVDDGNDHYHPPPNCESTPSVPPAVNDPFDPASLRINPDSAMSDFCVKKAIVTVPVRKPARDEWVRAHPSVDMSIQTGLLELKSERSTYLVARPLWSSLADDANFCRKALFLTMSRQGALFLWGVRLPGEDGRIDSWNEAAMQAALTAREQWVRMSSNMPASCYDIFTAIANIPDPEWPDLSLRDILALAFKNNHIDSLDHPVLRRLRGEV